MDTGFEMVHIIERIQGLDFILVLLSEFPNNKIWKWTLESFGKFWRVSGPYSLAWTLPKLSNCLIEKDQQN